MARQHYNATVVSPARRPAALFVLFAIGTVLVFMRLPSLMQPMGADQGLYAYIAERILRGELPYVDAWDQKPPAIHYTYAAMRALWASDAVVAAADLATAVVIAAFLFSIGRTLAGRWVGVGAALLFLALSNPAFTRLAGVRIRAQCETFIAVLVAAAVWAVLKSPGSRQRLPLAAGLFMGLAFAFKYNAIVYAATVLATMILWRTISIRSTAAFGAGFLAVPLAFLVLLAGALQPFLDATIAYNLQYSGETYAGPLHFAGYLLTFPVDRARDDALWTLGGGGCAVLLAASLRARQRLIPVIWVATACLSIAINGSRGLPQYFVQAAPGLALAAAWAGGILAEVTRRNVRPATARVLLTAGTILVAVAVWRVNQFPKLLEQTVFDARYALGQVSQEVYLNRYADERKYSARAAAEIGRFMREHTQPEDTIFVFGFTGAAYVYANRKSASRFFWSRPVIAGFNEGLPGYGAAGLLADLDRARPAVVALQIHDWAPDVDDSARFFLSTPVLATWLSANYRRTAGPEGFDVWLRR